MFSFRAILIGFCALSLSGCIFLRGYQPDGQQGHLVNEKKVGFVHTGMSKGQVAALLGTPIMDNTFDPNRWEYVHRTSDGKLSHLTVEFDHERVRHIG